MSKPPPCVLARCVYDSELPTAERRFHQLPGDRTCGAVLQRPLPTKADINVEGAWCPICREQILKREETNGSNPTA